MKTVILYASVHHKNTFKIIQQMAPILDADLIDITREKHPDLSDYTLVGFASGIYFNNLHKDLLECLSVNSFTKRQKVFLVYTCGFAYKNYGKQVQAKLAAKGIDCIGQFHCRGYDTYGPFAKIGGIAKNHPHEKDLSSARLFADSLVQRYRNLTVE